MEWRGEGMEGSDGGRRGVREGVVWCDAGLSFAEGGWSSVVGVAGWALLSVGVIREWGVVFCGWTLSSVGGRCRPWAGSGRL